MMAKLYGKASAHAKARADRCISLMWTRACWARTGSSARRPFGVWCGSDCQSQGTDQVTVCFFGDGAAEQAQCTKRMNLASIWKLPVIFVCENNGYAQTTPSRYHCSARNIVDRATVIARQDW